MSVAEAIALPAQPTIGAVVRIPLGGDGMNAPHSAYCVNFFGLTADASGGTGQLSITMDDRYCSLVGFAQGFIDGTSTDQVVRYQLTGEGTPTIVDNRTLLGHTSKTDVSGIWYPPTWVLPGGNQVCTLRLVVDNVDGDDPSLTCVVYNFDIRARELTNIGFLGYARGPVP